MSDLTFFQQATTEPVDFYVTPTVECVECVQSSGERSTVTDDHERSAMVNQKHLWNRSGLKYATVLVLLQAICLLSYFVAARPFIAGLFTEPGAISVLCFLALEATALLLIALGSRLKHIGITTICHTLSLLTLIIGTLWLPMVMHAMEQARHPTIWIK